MKGLCLHCGADQVERYELAQVELPQETRSYKPIAHNVFLDMVQEQMLSAGFHFKSEAHGLTKDGARYFGLIELANGQNSDDHALILGARNSLDKKFPASLAFGSGVFVCDNLAFTGEIVSKRKHTTNIMRDLPAIIAEMVSHTKTMQLNQNARFELYKGFSISDKDAHDLIIQLLLAQAINTSRIEGVVNEWHNPSFDHGDKAIWRLFNAVTQVLKGAPLHDVPGRTIQMQSVFDEVTGFKTFEMVH